MKIVIITNYWKNSNGGGIKTYVVNLVDALHDKGLLVNVIFRDGDDSIEYFGGKNKFLFVFASFIFLRKIRPDVIHSHGPWYCLLPGVIYKILFKCTLVHTFHSVPKKGMIFYSKIIFQRLLNACDSITFVSRALEETIESYRLSFPRSSITYGGVKARQVTEEEIAQFMDKYDIRKDAIIILAQAMTAHPQKAKGLELLIAAIRILQDKYPNIILIATRDGKYASELRSFSIEMGMKEKISICRKCRKSIYPIEPVQYLFSHNFC